MQGSHFMFVYMTVPKSQCLSSNVFTFILFCSHIVRLDLSPHDELEEMQTCACARAHTHTNCPIRQRANSDAFSCSGWRRARGRAHEDRGREKKSDATNAADSETFRVRAADNFASSQHHYIIIASASALAHCHHVNTPHCTLITRP